jgi:phospholipase C
MKVGRWVMAAAALATVVTAGASHAGASQKTTSNTGHIFYIMMENHSYAEIIGQPNTPNITTLANTYNLATDFHGVTHPSLPNYLAAISGSFQGIWDDCQAGATVTCPPEEFIPNSGDGTDTTLLSPGEYKSASTTPHMFSGPNIVDQLEANGLTWKAYEENLPSPGSEVVNAPVVPGYGTVNLYAQKHNPFMYFSDINYPGSPRLQDIVPLEGTLARDLANGTVPNFSFIVPNQCHDMHGISQSQANAIGDPGCATDSSVVAEGDTWVGNTVNEIMSSSTWQAGNSEIIIAWDENDYSDDTSGGPGSPVGAHDAVLGGGVAPLIVIPSNSTGRVVSDAPTDHYTTLFAVEQMFHLGCLNNTCGMGNGAAFMPLFANG